MASIPGIPGLKALLKMRGIIEDDTCRKPLRKLTEEEYKVLEGIFDDYKKEENL